MQRIIYFKELFVAVFHTFDNIWMYIPLSTEQIIDEFSVKAGTVNLFLDWIFFFV
jgi:hypothetical protein